MVVNCVVIASMAFALLVTVHVVAPPPGDYPMETKIKFRPSMAITLVCLISAFFFLACFAVYLRHCLDHRTAQSFTLASDGVGSSRIRRRAAVRGLSPALLDSFPTFVYSDVKGHKIGGCALECAVCLNEFEDDETLRLLPKCSHVFHPDCIGAWLVSHVTCPVCRANLVPRAGRSRTPSHVSDADPDDSEGSPDRNTGFVAVDFITDIGSADVINPNETPNQNLPSRMPLTKERNTGKFPRSHSTGHSLIQPGENCERYTLRLPAEVRNRLVNSSVERTKSCVAFPGLRSSKRSYRTNSWGSGTGGNYVYYERFDREGRSDRQRFTRTRDEVTATSKSLLKPVKSPFDRLFSGTDKDDVGERSFDRLRLDDDM